MQARTRTNEKTNIKNVNNSMTENYQDSSQNNSKENSVNKPVKRIKAGAIIATIWANEASAKKNNKSTNEEILNKEYTTYHTISLERVYKDKSDEWQQTSSLRTNDLPKAQLVLQKAYEWLALSGE